jgi:hypothetical protein
MSSVPPPGSGYPPPPPPPPQGPPPVMPSGPGLAWETQAIGPESFLDTAKLFITAPDQAWAKTRETGDYTRPLLFAVIIAWVGAIFNAVWGTMFGAGLMRMLPAQYSRFGAMGMGGGGLLANIILAPIFILCGLFIGSAIFHVSFMIVGALTNSKSQFEGTFRVVSYSSIAHIAYVIPLVGGLVALVWRIYLMMLGVQQLHRANQGKALMGILLPIVLCCGCAAIGMIFAGAALFSAFNR